MGTSYKPNGYSTLSPYLVVEGASSTIEFLKRVFGAVELRRFPDAEGKLMHAEVRIDDTVVMIADGGELTTGSVVRACLRTRRRCDICTGPRRGGDSGAGADEEGRRGQTGRREGRGGYDVVDRHKGGVTLFFPAAG